MNKIRHAWRAIYDLSLLAWSNVRRATRWQIALVLLLVLLTSALTALAPVALAAAIDRLNVKAEPGVSPFLLIGLYVFIQWATRAIGQLRDLLFGRADRTLNRALSAAVFSHVLQLPMRFHLERKTGAMQQAVSTGLQGFQMLLQQMLFTLLPVLIEIGVVAVVVAKLDEPFIAALLIVTVVAHAVIFGRGAIAMAAPAKDATAAQSEAAGVMTDALLNSEAIKGYGCEALVREKYDGALAVGEQEWRRFFNVRALNGLLIATVFGLCLAIGSFYAGWRAVQGTISVGQFVLIVFYLFQVVRPAELLGMAVHQLSQGYAYLTKLLEILHETPERLLDPGAGRSQLQGAVTFENVSVSYSDRPVLRDVSFQLPSGKTLGIVGASGAGKSTLAKLLLRLLEPDAGRILIDDRPIEELPLCELRRSIAVVPQETLLFNDTIAYNIAVGRPGSSRAEIEGAAKLSQLHDFVMSLPEQYDTRVGERGVKLSGGERQRVAIARAALRNPLIFIFDEATSSLDSATELAIVRNLKELAQHSTTLVIAHRLSTVLHADEIIVMRAGAIVERGSHLHLLNSKGTYAALWRAQQAAEDRKERELALV